MNYQTTPSQAPTHPHPPAQAQAVDATSGASEH